MSTASGFGRNFSRDVEAVLSTVQLGAQLGEVYLYPHEIRQNLRIAGMVLDNNVPVMPDFANPWEPPEGHEPEFDEHFIDNDDDIGEDTDV